MEFDDILDRLFNYFEVFTLQDLAKKMNVSQPSISKWKSRNSISAVKKKCRELGIYSEIFGDLNNTINILSELNKAVKDINKIDIDETTLFLFKQAYQNAKDKNNINKLRIYLMEFEAEPLEKITLKEIENVVQDIIEKKKNN